MALLVTANLGRGVSEDRFLANVRAIDDEAGAGTIIGLQEIDEDDKPNEHAGLRNVLAGEFSGAAWDTRVPICYGAKWSKIRSGVVGASTGLFRLSPARVIAELVVRHARKGLPPLVVLGVHFPRNDPRLLSRWRSVEAKLRKRIKYWHARGYTVVWMGDANRVRLAKMHTRERTLVHHGLDWIRVVEHPAGLQVEAIETGLIDLTIDNHDAPWVRVRLSAPKEKS